MLRVFGLVALLISLLIVALLYKHQLQVQGAAKTAAAASNADASLSVPQLNTAAQGQQLQQQIQNDLNKATQEHSQQLEQGVERSTQ